MEGGREGGRGGLQCTAREGDWRDCDDEARQTNGQQRTSPISFLALEHESQLVGFVSSLRCG